MKMKLNLNSLLFFVLILFAFLSSVSAESKSYKLQHRLGDSGEWTNIATFVVSRHAEQSPARLKPSVGPDAEMSKEQKDRLLPTDMIFYRAFPADSDKAEDVVEVSTSFCSLVRGFEAVDRSTLILREKLKVVPGSGASILGLQVSSDTNFFHSKMTNGDECDISVIQKLFPTVLMQVQVSLQQPTALMTSVRYKDLEDLQDLDKNKKAKKTETVQRTIRKVKNEEGEWVEEEVEIEEKTFFQKYWMYLVIPFGLQVVQGLIKK